MPRRILTKLEAAAAAAFKRLVEASDKTQEDLAAEIGVTQGMVWQWEENRGAELEADDEIGQIDPEVEIAAGSYDPFDPAVLDDKLYRSRLGPAMDRLSALQKRILEMLRLGLPIDSKDPAAVTISRSLGRSEKTIRTHRDKAYARLRIALTRGVD